MNNQLDNNNQINNNYNQNQNEHMQNNSGFNPATQQFQQVVNQSSMSNQPTNINQMSNNFNQNSGISEKLKKCRKILHRDSVFLMIVSIVAIVFGLIFGGMGSDSAIGLFVESIFYFIFFLIIIDNKKKIKKFIGVLAIIVSSFMIIFTIFSRSLFDIIYFILAIFYMIHAIQYLKNIKDYIYVEEKKEKLKIDKLKNISLVLIIMCVAYPILSLPLSGIYFFHKSKTVVLFLFSLTSLVLNIILFIKKRKSVTLYICSVFSIIITLLAGNYAFYAAESLLSYYTSYDSEEDKQELMYMTQNVVTGNVVDFLGNYLNEPLPNTSDIVLISKEMHEEAIKKKNEIIRQYKSDPETSELYKDINEYVSIYKENEKKGYVCDGYTVLQRFYSEKECMDAVNHYDCFNYDEEYKKGEVFSQTFIKCTGRYEYQTKGFDEEILNKSKNNKEEYINLGFKELEYNFNEAVIEEFEWDLKYDKITYKIINKKEYESEIVDNHYKSVFSKPKYTNYVCNGYVEVNFDVTTNEYYGQPYISCTGENNYQTNGFDNTKLSN